MWKIAKPPKFGFSFSKQGSAEIFKMQLFNIGMVVHLRVVQLSRLRALELEFMATLFSTFYHFDRPLPRWRPPCYEQYTVSEKNILSQIDVANKIVNTIWAPEGPLNAWKVIPTHCQNAQGHFGSHLTHLK